MSSFSANRLLQEKSPYLLQHAHNPVDWYPWGEEAFAKAVEENKPVFLSIGYSTCHWCHVMERESFEDPATAELLNTHFVPIKVDREERPDIDSIYMSFVTATTGSGGWPMSVFLTPNAEPFYGGTYFPPEARWGSPGFKDVLWSVHNSWTKQEAKVRGSGQSLVAAFSQALSSKVPSEKIFTAETLDKAYRQLENNFDTQNGGFGHQPKFPMGHNLSFLLRYRPSSGQSEAMAITEQTLTAMDRGGIHDQLAGGFHRYSTDSHWQVPHFEKMLYDQALLVKAYVEAYQRTKRSEFADTARKTLDYVLREMRDPSGGFYSAQDADSADPDHPNSPEKKEGAFYIWTADELGAVLSEKELRVFALAYGIEPNGNALFDPHGEFAGKNILYLKYDARAVAERLGGTENEILEILRNARDKLLARREQRPRPHLDDKILTDWNALMISGLAVAGRILGEERYVKAAKDAAQFISKHLTRSDGRLLHRYRDGEAGILGGLDDYAFLANALLDLYETTAEPQYLREAIRCAEDLMKLFWDEDKGGFFLTASDAPALVFRPKEVYDGAVPSGNSFAALALTRLSYLMGEDRYRKVVERTFRLFFDDVEAHPGAYCQLMIAAGMFVGGAKEIVFCGDPANPKGRALLDELSRHWLPAAVLIIKTPDSADELRDILPWIKSFPVKPELPRVYVCEKQSCRQPAGTPEELARALV